MKRFIFPVLAVLIPAGLLGYIFWTSEQKLAREYDEVLLAAKKVGLITSLDELKASLPPASENAATPILKPGVKFDWPKRAPALVKGSPGPYLAKTAEFEDILRTAAGRTRLALPIESIPLATESRTAIRQTLLLGVDRALAYSDQGNMAKAIETLNWVAKLRDMLVDASPLPIATEATVVNVRLQDAVLAIAGRYGAPAVQPMRKLFLKNDIRFDPIQSGKSLVAYSLANIDNLVLEAEKGDPTLAQLKDPAFVLGIKIAVIRQATDFVLPGKERTAEQLAMDMSRLNDYLRQGSYPDAELMNKLTMMQVAVGSRPPIAPDLLKWFWLTCEAGGKPPAGIENAYDIHYNLIKFRPIKDGFTIFAAGRNQIDEKGGGDDRWMSYQSGRFRYKW